MSSPIEQVLAHFPQLSVQQFDHLSPQEAKRIIQASAAASFSRDIGRSEPAAVLAQTAGLIRQVAARAPAIGVMLCMHHHVAVTWLRFVDLFSHGHEQLNSILDRQGLLASAFAEGIPGRDIFTTSVMVRQHGEHELTAHGQKKPCTLASCADYYASLVIDEEACTHALALIPADLPQIHREPFWQLDILQAADNQAVIFDGVKLGGDSLSRIRGDALKPVLSYGVMAFNAFACSAYCGAVDAMLALLPETLRNIPQIAREITDYRLTSQALIDAMLAHTGAAELDEQSVTRVLALRYQCEALIARYAGFALQTFGGVNVMTRPAMLYLFSVTQLLRFHPITHFQLMNTLAAEG